MHTKEKSQLYYHNDNTLINDSLVVETMTIRMKKIELL